MIVCSCNVLSDTRIREALASGPAAPARVLDVHHHFGCKPKCGTCARGIACLLREERGAAQGVAAGAGAGAASAPPAEPGVNEAA